MNDPNENRPGYKKTKVGWIPKEWNSKPLGTLGSFSKGKGISNNEKTDVGYPCITYGEIYTTHDIKVKNICSFINSSSADKSQEIHKGDLLFAGSGETLDEIGKCVAYLSNNLAYAGGDIIILAPNETNSLYLSYFLNSSHLIRFRRRLGQGHSVVHIYSSGLATLNVSLPKLSEQEKIAEILSTWDESIEKTQKLIEAKKLRKKGLMQQLLTGKKRLPEFSRSKNYKSYRFFDIPSDWKCPQINEIAQERSERNRSRETITVFSCSKHQGFVKSSDYFGKQIFSEDSSNYKIIRRNWFGFPANHVEEGSIGLFNHEIGIVSPIYVVFDVNDQILPEYLYALFKTETFRHIFAISTNASVDRRGSLRWREFSLIRVPLPSMHEQNAIMIILKTADDEINLLEKNLNALKEQKQGLMQKLLTGTIRVKI